MTEYTKMSKSRGNVVMIDEVVKGIYQLGHNYSFRDRLGNIVDWKAVGVWRDGTGYRTSTKDGKQPVFLCRDGDTEPVDLLETGRQHADDTEFWNDLVVKW